MSVGLMLLLAASSAILAPMLLAMLMPLAVHGTGVKIDTVKIVTTLLMSQLLLLGVGLLFRSRRPLLAEKLQKPASRLTVILSVVVFALIIAVQLRTLAELRWKNALGICALLLLCLAAGWALGGPTTDIRKAVGLTTAARNVGVGLVIATASFPDSVAVTAVVLFAIFQTVGLVLIAMGVGRWSVSSP